MSISYDRDELPWYKYFWPWFFIGLPLLTVLGGIHYMYLAVHDSDGLVADDYYKRGLAINQVLEKDQRADDLGLMATGYFDFDRKLVHLHLTGLKRWPASMTLALLHPTRAHRDHKIMLHKQPGNGEYLGVISSVSAGNWHLMLQPPDRDWRLTTRFRWPGGMHWSMKPVKE